MAGLTRPCLLDKPSLKKLLHAAFDMCFTCKYANNMSKMIQLRNVPDGLHRSLKARAAMAGMSLSDYLLGEIKEIGVWRTLAELQQGLHTRKPLSVELDTARLVREVR